MSFHNLAIDPQRLPQAAALEFEPLPQAHRHEVMVEQALVWLVLITALSIGAVLSNFGFTWWQSIALVAAIGLPLAALAIALAYFSAAAKGLGIREWDIAYRSGLIWRKVTFIVFERIQHVELAHGPISRAFGLASLKFYTAGGTQVDLKIPGLKQAQADQLRQYVLTRMGAEARVDASEAEA